jgi:predicted Zn-dependent protease
MRRSLLSRSLLLTAVAVVVGASTVDAGQLVRFGRSDADSILLLHAYYPGYWWDHTDLTVAVQSSPNVDPVFVEAIRDAIATWSEVLEKEFPYVSLTDVTDEARNAHRADIVVHYVPHAGGIVWGGYAVCGDHKCNNILVRSDVPDLIDVGVPDYDPERVYRVALHELGHALGLGHAEPLEETNDLMGYGWSVPEPDTTPVLSTCDIKALGVVFEWTVQGVDPYPSTATSVTC